MQFLIRFAQAHESFRKPELEALAHREGITFEILYYRPESPFCVIRLQPSAGSGRSLADTAKSFISQSILSRGIYELLGQGVTYDDLHKDIVARGLDLWQQYKHASFRFSVDAFCGKRSSTQTREIINSFRYVGLQGKILMNNPELEFMVFEEWEQARQSTHDDSEMDTAQDNGEMQQRQPKMLFLGRYVGGSNRRLVDKHDLKKRPYISTTSMDAELALITANLALAGPGKIFFDPFVGTGGFMVAASELGALTLGADIDGRSFRGKGTGLMTGVGANFNRYGLSNLFGDCFTSDLVNTPLRTQGSQSANSIRWLDGIIADPPYGVREGLKVLGRKPIVRLMEVETSQGATMLPRPQEEAPSKEPHYIGGVLAHTLPGYIAPKKQYSFVRMLDDILDFAARTLVDGGRLAFWMPSANEHDQELALPQHPLLVLKHVSIQVFNKWSRRLLVFERVKGDVDHTVEMVLAAHSIKSLEVGANADDLNEFRRLYFKGFQADAK